MNAFEYIKFSDLNQNLEDFVRSLLMHFMLEDVPWSLQEVFQNLNMQIFQVWVRLWKISQKTLERLSEIPGRLLADSETLGRLLADFLRSLLMYFMLEDFPRSLRKVLCPKWYKEMMSSGVQAYLCWGMISNSMCNSFVYGLFYDMYVHYLVVNSFVNLKKC